MECRALRVGDAKLVRAVECVIRATSRNEPLPGHLRQTPLCRGASRTKPLGVCQDIWGDARRTDSPRSLRRVSRRIWSSDRRLVSMTSRCLDGRVVGQNRRQPRSGRTQQAWPRARRLVSPSGTFAARGKRSTICYWSRVSRTSRTTTTRSTSTSARRMVSGSSSQASISTSVPI